MFVVIFGAAGWTAPHPTDPGDVGVLRWATARRRRAVVAAGQGRVG